MKNQKSKKIKIWLTAFFGIIVVGYAASFNNTIRHLSYTAYYDLFKFDHFNANEKIYAGKHIADTKEITSIVLWRKMRPLTLDELKTLDRDLANQLNLDENKINLTGETFMVHSNVYLDVKKMKLRQSTYMGNYLRSTYFKMLINRNNKSIFADALFYAITPDKTLFDAQPTDIQNLPANYTLADSTWYLLGTDGSNKDRLFK